MKVLRHSVPLRNGLASFAVLLCTSIGLYSVLWTLDFAISGPMITPVDLVADPAIVSNMGGVPEVAVAVLGIAITVVAIIVELAATRYTPRISEMFLKDPVNAGILGLYMVTAVLVLWTDLSLSAPSHPTNMILFTLCCVSVSLVTVLPYFAYVFAFLNPSRVVLRTAYTSTSALAEAGRGSRLVRSREQMLEGVGQLGELALNSVQKHDKAALTIVPPMMVTKPASSRPCRA